jgi:hypothetical protein
MNRPSPARILSRRAHAPIRCVSKTKESALARRLVHARVTNPVKVALMAKRKTKAAPKLKQRPRAEIDRNYFLGDVFMRTGAALFVALALVSAYTPFSWGQAQHHGASFGAVVAMFAVAGVGLYLYGRHLRREATHWEAD